MLTGTRTPMRVLVDLQALQTTHSRRRGIGRYSLALFRAMASAGRDVELSALLNHAFDDELEETIGWIDDVVPRERIHVFASPGKTSLLDPANLARARAAARLLQLHVDGIAPDFVHVASLFESYADDSVTTIVPDGRWAATVYDLIPWYRRDVYLRDRELRRAYMMKLDLARHARVLFAISDSARREAIETLGLPSDRVVDIQGDADAMFCEGQVPASREAALRQRLHLPRPFVLYTAGIDHRKNIEGLIRAYAELPAELRRRHQLAIVCRAEPAERAALAETARRAGLERDDLVCTGYVSDAELCDLYRLCALFVFPSLHEGFGLPILEAMRCGAPVIGSNCSSMPEILGIRDAQFDPHSIESMTAALVAPLRDPGCRDRLVENSRLQRRRFSWDESARRVLDAFDAARETASPNARRDAARPTSRPSLAFVSPLPPERSGIANYSAELLPLLSRHYDVTLVTDLPRVDDPWLDGTYPLCSRLRFEANAARFDRVVYQIGNSAEFHGDALDMLERHPGVVVLHDFFLSNLFNHLDGHGSRPGILQRELFRSHGFPPLVESVRGPHDDASRRDVVVWRYPASRIVFELGYGTIVHSAFAVRAARAFYGVEGEDLIVRIGHLRNEPHRRPREIARAELGIPADAVVVCSFGLVSRTKLNLELVRAWCSGDLAKRTDALLLLVGPGSDALYEAELRRVIAANGAQARIRLVGFVDDEAFRTYLEATDCAVQLRTGSRGETSGAVLHCFANGVPVVVNRHGTLAELPPDTALQVPDRFGDDELATAIATLVDDPEERRARSEAGLRFVREECHGPMIAARYRDAIERFYERNPNRRLDEFVTAVIGSPSDPLDDDDTRRIVSIASDQTPLRRRPQCLVDITGATQGGGDAVLRRLFEMLLDRLAEAVRVEAIAWDGTAYRYARATLAAILALPDVVAVDEEIEVRRGDRIFVADPEEPVGARRDALRRFRQRGVGLAAIADLGKPDAAPGDALVDRSDWADCVIGSTGPGAVPAVDLGERSTTPVAPTARRDGADEAATTAERCDEAIAAISASVAAQFREAASRDDAIPVFDAVA